MAERFFPRLSPGAQTPLTVAQSLQAQKRREVHQDAKLAARRLLTALQSVYDFDSTGNVLGALDHVIARGEQLIESLRDLEQVSVSFRESQESRRG